uniref:Putative secreted protein n=1 Tax=Amblyomma americanum TaxID=6943 RepID=A0A0C9SCM2_AMBAM
MRSHLVCTVIFLLYVHSLMKSLNACDPTKRQPDKTNPCAGKDCDRGKCKQVGCSKCTGSNPWCAGYCTK